MGDENVRNHGFTKEGKMINTKRMKMLETSGLPRRVKDDQCVDDQHVECENVRNLRFAKEEGW